MEGWRQPGEQVHAPGGLLVRAQFKPEPLNANGERLTLGHRREATSESGKQRPAGTEPGAGTSHRAGPGSVSPIARLSVKLNNLYVTLKLV